MAYVYRHIRLDKNEVFYIGIGSDDSGKYKRAYDNNRSKFWKSIVKKAGYIVEIISEDWLTWEEACEKEKFWIIFYGRADLGKGSLVNMTDGGDGILGYIVSEEDKRKRSLAKLGDKNPSYGIHYNHTEETIAKMKLTRSKQKIQPMQGKYHSEETKAKMRKSSKNSKKIKHIKTGLIFDRVIDAANYFNMPVSTVSWQAIRNINFVPLKT